MMFTKEWFIRATVRAVKTAAQTFIAVVGTTTFLDLEQWKAATISALSAAILSYITSLAGLPELEGDKDGLQDEI